MNKKKQLLQNTLIIAIGKISTQIISYILLPLYTAALTPEQYGLYDYVVTVSTFVCTFLTMLMENGMLRCLIDAKNKDEKKILLLFKQKLGFPGSSVVKNLPANPEDLGSIPVPGRPHLPQSN